MDRGEVTGVLFLDLKKAFDTVNHDLLLQKLFTFGVEGPYLQWFRDYLSGRKQATCVNGVLSQSLPISFGVPQGSILGPLLFIMYINDLPQCVTNGKVALYADDTAVFYSAKNIHEVQRILEGQLSNVSQWLSENQLTLNLSKTKSMTIGSRQILAKGKLNLNLRGSSIENVESFKYLGVLLDERLTWDQHVDFLCKKVSKRLGVLRRASEFLDIPSRKLLYYALILPIFDYCDVVWGNCSITLSNRTQVLQNRAGRLILGIRGLYRDTPVEHILDSLGWVKLDARRKFHLDFITFKILQCGPTYLADKFTRVSHIHSHRTRATANSMFYIPRFKSSTGQRSFIFRATMSFNQLPQSVRQAPSKQTFRSLYHSWSP